MNREEAIRCLSVHSSTNGSGLCTDKQHYEAKQIAIKALEQEPCEDAISRQAVTDTTICDGISCNECSFNTCEDGQAGCLLKERVDKLPSITPQPKTGHWILDESDNSVTCDKCDCSIYPNDISNGEPHYCPNCGAKMEVSE